MSKLINAIKNPKMFFIRIRTELYKIHPYLQLGSHCQFYKIHLYKPASSKVKIPKNLVSIGNGVIIFRRTELTIFENYPIIIGDNSFLNQDCIVGPNTFIGKNVSVGHKVSFVTATHKIGDTNKRASDSVFLPIKIEDGCWIGAGSIILPGVTIGKGTIIAAGSVVNKDCKSNYLYAGNPATPIKPLS